MTHGRSRWRNGLVVALVTFMALVAAMVAISLSQRVDLVADDYYERSLRHEQRLSSSANARHLGSDFSLQKIGDELLVAFPRDMDPAGIAGRCILYRASDRSLDRRIDLQPDSTGFQRIGLATMVRGLWKAQISWEYRGTSYYFETPVTLD